MSNSNGKLAEVEENLKSAHGWTCVNFNFFDKKYITRDLETCTPAEAAKRHHDRAQLIAASVRSEFLAKHSAMSPSGARAYSDNWN